MPASLATGMRATDTHSTTDKVSVASEQHSRKPDKRPFIVRWRSAVLSPAGPKSSAARLVLVALSNWMNAKGGSCWPSTTSLSEATALSRRAVGMHLAQAVETGWITRERRGVGLYNRGYTYQATVPPEVEL